MARLATSIDHSPEDLEWRQLALIVRHHANELTPWEIAFLGTITQLNYRLSDKQKAVLQQLVRKAPAVIQERLATGSIFSLWLEMLRDAGWEVRTR